MTYWGLLIFSALTILFCRVFLFLFANYPILSNKDGKFYKFLTYSTQAMLGGIVYATAFGSQNVSELFVNFPLLNGSKSPYLFLFSLPQSKLIGF